MAKILSKVKSVITAPFRKLRARLAEHHAEHPRYHKSFHRSYREDYTRPSDTPGLLAHAMLTFRMIFRNWRLFLPFIILMAIAYTIAVGLLSEDVYVDLQGTLEETSSELAAGKLGNFAKSGLLLFSTVTTGGLDNGMGETQTAFMIILFLVMWLVTLYLLRHLFAGEKLKLRDGLYNALTPLISTLAVFLVMFLQALPAILFMVAYSAALATDFLATPFYALLFFLFAVVMLLISGYLLSSSIIALIAVTTPGMYPFQAIFAASDLMAGRRIRLIIRLIYLLIVIALIYVIIMLPIIWVDLGLKSAWTWLGGTPIVPFCLVMTTCFAFIYLTTYLYQYYRWMLQLDHKTVSDLPLRPKFKPHKVKTKPNAQPKTKAKLKSQTKAKRKS